MAKENWIWMPHPGHFICSADCKFHLNTKVGKYIVSTVGEYWPDAPIREIFAEMRGIKLEGKGDERKRDYLKKVGYEDVGCDRKYETMVFKAKKVNEKCCPWRMINGENLDFNSYNDSGEATKGHYRMCRKWDKK